MVRDGVNLLCSVANMVLIQDACYCLLAGISLHDSLECAIELRKDRGGSESSS